MVCGKKGKPHDRRRPVVYAILLIFRIELADSG